jgi:hypothetical protein
MTHESLSGRQLATFLGVSAQTVSRWQRSGVIRRQRNGRFALQSSVQDLVRYFVPRHRWAFHQLRVCGIFDESAGDTIKDWALLSEDD